MTHNSRLFCCVIATAVITKRLEIISLYPLLGLTILRHLCESPIQSHQGLPGSSHTYLVETSSRNLDFLTRSLVLPPQKREVIRLVLQLTCIRDLHILVLALDAVFALSTQGPAFCDALILTDELEDEDEEDSCLNNGPHHLIGSLITFLTFEAQSFGSEGLIRIRVMQVRTFFSNLLINCVVCKYILFWYFVCLTAFLTLMFSFDCADWQLLDLGICLTEANSLE